jgi:predicted metal-dependent HD superfamily phosphohydrolase
LIKQVEELILATKHVAPPATPDAQFLVDIDLSILGQRPSAFDEFERAIREEYRHVDEPSFRAGRSEILRRFLDRPFIYFTHVFRRRYEQQARSNLNRSLERLRFQNI